MNIYELENIIEPFVSIDFNGHSIAVKKHISENLKIAVAQKIKKFYFAVDGVSSPDTDITCKDLKNACYIYSVLDNYTDVKLGEDNDYVTIATIATESGLLDKVLSCIPLTERAMFKEAIDNAIENEYRKIAEENSIENQLKKFLEMVLSKIPDDKTIRDLLKSVKKDFKNFDVSKLNFLNDKSKEFGGKEIPNAEQVDKLVDGVINLFDKKEKK
jgi:hypothetical protein